TGTRKSAPVRMNNLCTPTTYHPWFDADRGAPEGGGRDGVEHRDCGCPDPSLKVTIYPNCDANMAIIPDSNDRVTMRRPDDWHVRLRDGAMLAAVVPFTARQFARAIVMPTLVPPVTTVAAARAYRERILAALPADVAFTPLMTCYLTDATDPRELARGWE